MRSLIPITTALAIIISTSVFAEDPPAETCIAESQVERCDPSCIITTHPHDGQGADRNAAEQSALSVCTQHLQKELALGGTGLRSVSCAIQRCDSETNRAQSCEALRVQVCGICSDQHPACKDFAGPALSAKACEKAHKTLAEFASEMQSMPAGKEKDQVLEFVCDTFAKEMTPKP